MKQEHIEKLQERVKFSERMLGKDMARVLDHILLNQIALFEIFTAEAKEEK